MSGRMIELETPVGPNPSVVLTEPDHHLPKPKTRDIILPHFPMT